MVTKNRGPNTGTGPARVERAYIRGTECIIKVAAIAAVVVILRGGLPEYNWWGNHDNGFMANELACERRADASRLEAAQKAQTYPRMKKIWGGQPPDVLAWQTPEGRAEALAANKRLELTHAGRDRVASGFLYFEYTCAALLGAYCVSKLLRRG
jgi:hypothetical protein